MIYIIATSGQYKMQSKLQFENNIKKLKCHILSIVDELKGLEHKHVKCEKHVFEITTQSIFSIFELEVLILLLLK